MTVAIKPKLSVVELSALYDRIYDIADRLLKKHNPCKIYTEDKYIFCKYHETGIPLRNKCYLCCSSCEYCSKEGCTVKCLGCKLFLCGLATKERKKLEKIDGTKSKKS